MLMNRHFVVISAFTLLSVVFAGCSSESLPADLPQLTRCQIKITQEGSPLEGATVTLHSLDGMRQWGAGGLSNAAGIAEIYTNGRYPGAPAGKYKVVVSKIETDPSQLPPAPPQNDPGYPAWHQKAESEVRQSYSVIEKKFTEPGSTPHEIDITEGKTAETTLDVGKKVRHKIS